MTNDELKAHYVAEAEAAVAAAEAKVAKLEAHLDGAREGVAAAQAHLSEVEAQTFEYVEPSEHVRAQAR